MTDRRSRILVVDDDVLIRDLWCDFLATIGYEVMAASDGEQALALLQADAYDLVLTDLFMPGMGGWTLLEATRQRFATPVVLITGTGTPADTERAGAEGVVLLHKPVQLHELQGAVERALEWSPGS